MNSMKFLQRVGAVSTVKPTCLVVFGHSTDWNDPQHRQYRILNSSYHNLSFLKFDQVLARAKRMISRVSQETRVEMYDRAA
jgi:hypothetical protein